jgi:hypothetical protein
MRLAYRLAVGLVLVACDDPGPKPRPFAAPAVSAPSAAASAVTPHNPSVRIDGPGPLVPRDQRLKPVRRGNQVVIDSEGKWDRDCDIHHKCKLTEEALPICTTNRDAESWQTMALRAEHFTDPHVVVRGRLVPDASAFSTAVYCTPAGACCNRRRAGFLLEGPPSDLRLDRPACVGDESRLCCRILAEGQDVIATGDLGYQSGVWSMANVSLCRVAD